MQDEAAMSERAGAFWDGWEAWRRAQPNRIRWNESAEILRHINRRICGRPVEGFNQGLIERLKEMAGSDLPLVRGVSVGCGNGGKEMTLLQQGLVGHFDLYDVSKASLDAGAGLAAAWRLTERTTFLHGDAFARPGDGRYDLVFWDNALHHMFDARAALRWSYDALRPGGWLVMNDFVGADRFQFPWSALMLVRAVRTLLPARYRRNPNDPANPYRPFVPRPTLAEMEVDPSEAADSEAILPGLRDTFPDAWIRSVGGTVYHLALNDILTNIPDGSRLLALLLRLDDLTDFIPHFAVAIARKPPSR
jgi:SAM-dependent methyltransferase